jgi:succinate dehydrogenase/fumarate reductase-like Fe-S protein
MSDARSELTVSLWRGAQEGRYESYNVPLRENQTVLDVVTFVQRTSTRRCPTASPAASACAARVP